METLYVKQLGSGKQHLVMLHGWANTHAELLGLANLLSPYFSIHLIDLPGFGNSNTPPPSWSAADYAKTISLYLKEKNIDKTSILGHSFGGKVAVSFGALFPEITEKLVLISASGLLRKKSLKSRYIKWKGIVYKIWDNLFGDDLFNKRFVPAHASRDWKEAGKMRPILVRSVNEDYSQFAKQISAKTLLIYGMQDRDTPIELGEKYHRLIPHSELILLPQHGHHPFKDAGASLCSRYILQFFKQESALCG